MSRLVRVGWLALLLVVTGSCTSTTKSASSDGGATTSLFQGPPTGTLPPLSAPLRSFKPVFSGEASAVEAAFRARLADFDRKDVDAAVASSTDSTPTLHADLTAFMNTYEIRLFRITAIDVK